MATLLVQPERSRVPAYLAFKMFGNYDDKGSSFGGDVLDAEVVRPGRGQRLRRRRRRRRGHPRAMLINKDPADDLSITLGIDGLGVDPSARTFSYGPASAASIVSGTADVGAPLVLPASSITVVELDLT